MSVVIRDADNVLDLTSIERLWRDYLAWANDELDVHFGFRLPVADAIARDLATIDKFSRPDGRLLLAVDDHGAVDDERAVGIVCQQRLTADTAEVKRMYVEPSQRGAGIGRALLDELLAGARAASYRRVRLDSPVFMTAAHGLYRAAGFVDIAPYGESEIPDEYKEHWVFMERPL